MFMYVSINECWNRKSCCKVYVDTEREMQFAAVCAV
jgi:hypothetical protein